MKITGQSFTWEVDKDIYGKIYLGVLFLHISGWKYNYPEPGGTEDIIKDIKITWEEGEEMVDLPIFKTDSQLAALTVTYSNNVLCVIVKINDEIILREEREYIQKDNNPIILQDDEEIYS
ncbi:MAG TPA: hypothetical protein VMW95_09430 [Desulfobacterales bacterium]|nr:hypothetical protein [Desulfobacterales bacterium]